MSISAADVKALRERTGSGIMDCKRALAECAGDLDEAIKYLQVKGMAAAAKKAGRVASEGLVHAYVHTGGRVGVLLEVNCETDFVAKTDQFVEFVNDVALHIAAMNPQYLQESDIAADARAAQQEIFEGQAAEAGKPANIAERMVQGKMRKWASDVCLLSQAFVKDPDKTVEQLQTQATAAIGEKVAIRRFVRWEMGEGLEKRVNDLAAEVAAATRG